MLQKLDLPAGIWRNGTQYQAAGRWYDMNLVRWVGGVMRPIGGWTAIDFGEATPDGTARAMLAWRANDGGRWIAIGTSQKLYAVSSSYSIINITPAGFTAGNSSTTAVVGYGYGAYGEGAYGTPRPDTGDYTFAATWQFDTWGEYLIACCTSDGDIYEWDVDADNDAVAIANAPTSCKSIVVTEERHLMALGAGGDPRKVAWSDREDNTTWTASQTNLAGSFTIQTTGTLQCGRRVRGSTLLFTDLDVHQANYLGYPLVYGFEKIGSNCGVIGPNAVTAVDSQAFWMGSNSFFVYNGTVNKLPSDVQDYVFSDVNRTQGHKVFAFFNSINSEVWWLYPSAGSAECNRYVAYNWAENHWMIGEISRTCGVDRGVFIDPMMIGTNNVLYKHETGFQYDGAVPFAKSGPIEIGNGDTVMHALKLIPDEKTAGDCFVEFAYRQYPNATEQFTAAYSLASPTSVRFTGRQASLFVKGSRSVDWRWGSPRLEIKPGGLRG